MRIARLGDAGAVTNCMMVDVLALARIVQAACRTALPRRESWHPSPVGSHGAGWADTACNPGLGDAESK